MTIAEARKRYQTDRRIYGDRLAWVAYIHRVEAAATQELLDELSGIASR